MSDSIPTLRSFDTRWEALDLAVPIPLYDGLENGPKEDLHVALIRDNETGHIYTDDLPVVLRAKFAGGTALRGLDIAFNVSQAYALYELAKIIPDAKQHLTTADEPWRWDGISTLFHERWEKACDEARKVPRNLYYQSQLIYTCLFAPMRSRQGLYKARAKVDRLEWKHKKKKSKLLMPCCHRLNRTMIRRSNTDDRTITLEGAQRTILAERDLLTRLAIGSISRQFMLHQWVGSKSANFKTIQKHHRIVDPRGWNSRVVTGTRDEFMRRIAGHGHTLNTDEQKDLFQEDLELRFQDTSFVAPGNLVLWHKNYCVATCILWAREVLTVLQDVDVENSEQYDLQWWKAAFLPSAEQLSKGASTEALYEQAVYRALVGNQVSAKTWTYYRKALVGQAVKAKKVPLLPLIENYDQMQTECEGPGMPFRAYAIQELDQAPTEEQWALITELDLLFGEKYGFYKSSDPDFEFRLSAKNALAKKHGLQLRLAETVVEGKLYMVNQPQHTLMVIPLVEGKYLIFEPAVGLKLSEDAPWDSSTPLLEAYPIAQTEEPNLIDEF